MTTPFHSDETGKLDDEWLTYGKTLEANSIRLQFACHQLGRDIKTACERFMEAFRKGQARAKARREEQAEQEGGQQ